MLDLDMISSFVRTLNKNLFKDIYLADNDGSKVVYHLHADTELFEMSFHQVNEEQKVLLRSVSKRLTKGSCFREIFYGKFDSCSWNKMNLILYDNFTNNVFA